MLRAADNPFAVHRVLRQRYRLSDPEWDELIARLARQRWRGAIVGPQGSGKTTLLEDLAARLARQGRGDVRCVDGADQLTRAQWLRLRWRPGGLVITTHVPGMLPLLHECRTSHALLRELTSALGAPLSDTDAAALYRRHRGNIRASLRELYDGAAGLLSNEADLRRINDTPNTSP